jgi:hypothetical protein
MNQDRITHPLTQAQIDRAKFAFITDNGSLTRCSCNDCGAQKANACSLQFDSYNIDGDCLAEK